jgi:hypothetical protein
MHTECQPPQNVALEHAGALIAGLVEKVKKITEANSAAIAKVTLAKFISFLPIKFLKTIDPICANNRPQGLG